MSSDPSLFPPPSDEPVQTGFAINLVLSNQIKKLKKSQLPGDGQTERIR